jgi:hypothetical protein
MSKSTHNKLLLAGVALTFVSVVLYALLEIAAGKEQALSLGEKSLGVAALGMMFGIPILATGTAGILCLACGSAMLLYRKLFAN